MDQWTNITVEKRLIGNLLSRPEIWTTIQADFDPEIFSDPTCRMIAKAWRDVALGGGKPSATRVGMRLIKEGDVDNDHILREMASSIDSMITADEADNLMAILRDKWQRRHVYTQLHAAMKEIRDSDPDTPTDQILSRAQEALVAGFIHQGKREIIPWIDALDELYREWQDANSGKAEIAYPTGISTLTSALGGMRRKRVYLLAGRPSMGKSALAMNIVKEFAGRQHRRCMVCTLEQSATEFAQRALSSASSIPAELWSRYPWEDPAKDRLNSSLSATMEWPIDLVDIRRPTVDKLKMLCRVEKAQHPDLACIVVDYMQEIRIDIGRGQNLSSAIGDVASELRAIAGELDVILILVSQLNRSLEQRENKRPMMSDLRDSGRLEEVADTILFLYRAGYYKPVSETLDNVSEIIIAKNRQGGGAGKTALAYFDRSCMRFDDLEDRLKQQYLSAYGARKDGEDDAA